MLLNIEILTGNLKPNDAQLGPEDTAHNDRKNPLGVIHSHTPTLSLGDKGRIFKLKSPSVEQAKEWEKVLGRFARANGKRANSKGDEKNGKTNKARMVITEGFLMKRALFSRHLWQKRYFILAGSTLYYQKNKGIFVIEMLSFPLSLCLSLL